MGITIYSLIQVYLTIMLIYAIMSWFPSMRQSSFRIFLGKIVEPYVGMYRQVVPLVWGIDFSFLVAYIVLDLCAYSFLLLF